LLHCSLTAWHWVLWGSLPCGGEEYRQADGYEGASEEKDRRIEAIEVCFC